MSSNRYPALLGWSRHSELRTRCLQFDWIVQDVKSYLGTRRRILFFIPVPVEVYILITDMNTYISFVRVNWEFAERYLTSTTALDLSLLILSREKIWLLQRFVERQKWNWIYFWHEINTKKINQEIKGTLFYTYVAVPDAHTLSSTVYVVLTSIRLSGFAADRFKVFILWDMAATIQPVLHSLIHSQYMYGFIKWFSNIDSYSFSLSLYWIRLLLYCIALWRGTEWQADDWVVVFFFSNRELCIIIIYEFNNIHKYSWQ